MSSSQSRTLTQHQLENPKVGFSEAYMAVQYLGFLFEEDPETIDRNGVDAILTLLASDRHGSRRQAYFLYRRAARILTGLCPDTFRNHHPSPVSGRLTAHIIHALQALLLQGNRAKIRAVSEALGRLPLRFSTPDKARPRQADNTLETICINGLARFCGVTDSPGPEQWEWIGRTLVNASFETGKLLCIKLLRRGQPRTELASEIHWISQIRGISGITGLPEPIPGRSELFKPARLPMIPGAPPDLEQPFAAIGFMAPASYFHYLNEPQALNAQLLPDRFGSVAFQLGHLAGQGLAHTAVIPLFHNRVQQGRRTDQGVYNWQQGGRLDQWLSSSQYPNLSLSGIRDFEHFLRIESSDRLHHTMGEQLLALVLVAGSYFRNKDKDNFGIDDQGRPKDLRHLFDKTLFLQILQSLVRHYCRGVARNGPDRSRELVTPDLVENLVRAMGRDDHMEEVLRIQDQARMSQSQFNDFLRIRGMSPEMAGVMEKDKEEIVLLTGPHLGGFNRAISVPALIDLLFTLSSLTISDRYLHENSLSPSAWPPGSRRAA